MRTASGSSLKMRGWGGILLASTLLLACQSRPEQSLDNNTLDAVDTVSGDKNAKVFIKPRSEEEIRQAYTEYLNNAAGDEETRLNALTRLAELEYSSGNSLISDQPDANSEDPDSAENKLYLQRLERTIQLLTTSLQDFPNAKGNDSLYYQLAKAQAQYGDHNASVESLASLVEKYPNSSYYAEAQFRIAEDAFSLQDYSAAEYAYSEVILSPENDIFYEKSLFKRGWARFKQRYYSDAIDDFIQAVLNHQFGAFETLSAAEKEQFNEFFRAIALSFTYQNDTDRLAEYFKNRPDFRYVYHSYRMIGDLYLKQERYSDAVETHQQFIANFPESDDIPYSYLKIIEIWKKAGFEQQIYQAIEDFYVTYNPASQYWINQNENSKVNRVIRRAQREYIVLMASYYHNRYQTNGNDSDLGNADRWYQRYLKFYQAYARQDNIFFLYGELLTEINQPVKALGFYEMAAFDNELILHQEAVYAAIVASDKLYTSSLEATYLDKNLSYAKRFTREYPQDPRAHQIALRAAEQAFHGEKYKTTIELADLALTADSQKDSGYVNELRANAYYRLDEYETAETIYRQLILTSNQVPKKQREYRDNLALSIYRQGEQARDNNDIPRSIYHFERISASAPESKIAATGLFDGIALHMQSSQWAPAIASIERFQRLYPDHELRSEVSRKLSVAYLNSDQGVKAAQEFEKLASIESDREVKAAAQWKAAELYEQKNQIGSAIQAYQKYAANYQKPYPQMLEAMHRIAMLHQQQGSSPLSHNWQKKIIEADEKALNNVRSDQSRYITSLAYLTLARHEKSRFDGIKLKLPLKTSLRNKKSVMQSSVKLFGKASLNKNYDITTEATYSIAKIYQDFSQALLASDRPANLNEDELDQYEILLEDQAFPFEDKSIEFFEINLSRIKDGLYNDWIQMSHRELINLFPVRYDRQPIVDDFIAAMQ